MRGIDSYSLSKRTDAFAAFRKASNDIIKKQKKAETKASEPVNKQTNESAYTDVPVTSTVREAKFVQPPKMVFDLLSASDMKRTTRPRVIEKLGGKTPVGLKAPVHNSIPKGTKSPAWVAMTIRGLRLFKK